MKKKKKIVDWFKTFYGEEKQTVCLEILLMSTYVILSILRLIGCGLGFYNLIMLRV